MLAISGGENVKFEDWDELFATVNRIYPSYKDNIAKFCRMSEIQMKVCVLLKIGVSFSDISVLVIRSKDTVYSICTRLYFKNFKRMMWQRPINNLKLWGCRGILI